MPQRFLRPGLTTSKRWNRCDYFSQTFYTRLITLVDDHGRYDADPELLRSQAFPFGDPEGNAITLLSIENSCQQLLAKGLLKLYSVEDKQYLQLLRWKERARSDSRYPGPGNSTVCEHLTTNDSKCSPPKPSPSPLVSSLRLQPSPPPSVDDQAGGGNDSVELPPRFPITVDDAIAQSETSGVPKDFVSKTWDKAVSRGGKDAKEVPIRSWSHYVKSEWNYEEDRLKRQQNANDNNGKASGRSHQHTDRSVGTTNEGTASLYRGLGKVAKVPDKK